MYAWPKIRLINLTVVLLRCPHLSGVTLHAFYDSSVALHMTRSCSLQEKIISGEP